MLIERFFGCCCAALICRATREPLALGASAVRPAEAVGAASAGNALPGASGLLEGAIKPRNKLLDKVTGGMHSRSSVMCCLCV